MRPASLWRASIGIWLFTPGLLTCVPAPVFDSRGSETTTGPMTTATTGLTSTSESGDVDEPTSTGVPNTSTTSDPPLDPPHLTACGSSAFMIGQHGLPQPPSALGLADLDEDGDLDLFAALATKAQIELAFNDGKGNFTSGSPLALGPPQADVQVAVGRLDGDIGAVVLVATRSDSHDLAVFLAQQGNYLQGPPLAASGSPRAVAVTDVNLDGAVDILALTESPAALSVWFGDNLGNFAPELTTSLDIPAAITTITDFNTDTVPDVLSISDHTLHLYAGDLTGHWSLADELNLGASGWTQALASDIDGNGPAELIITRSAGDGGLVRLDWGVQFEEWQGSVSYSTASPLLSGRLADVSADGVGDLVASTGQASVAVLMGDSFRGFRCELVFDIPSPTAATVMSLGDVNGDGRSDVIVGSHNTSQISVYIVLD